MRRQHAFLASSLFAAAETQWFARIRRGYGKVVPPLVHVIDLRPIEIKQEGGPGAGVKFWLTAIVSESCFRSLKRNPFSLLSAIGNG